MKQMLRLGFFISLYVLGMIALPLSALAHRDGCHRWHSCPSDSGSYVCGDTGNYSQCPGGGPSAPQPAINASPPPPRQPVLTHQTVVQEKDIPYATKINRTSREYSGYSKIRQEGALGKKKVYFDVTYTDGQETGRKETNSETIIQPKPKVTVRGTRIKPASKFTSINKTSKKEKYDIKGKYRPNEEVVLALNDKKIKRAKTDRRGNFSFKQIKITKNDSNLKIHRRKDRKENQISEKTFVDLKKLSLTTEYARIHSKK